MIDVVDMSSEARVVVQQFSYAPAAVPQSLGALDAGLGIGEGGDGPDADTSSGEML